MQGSDVVSLENYAKIIIYMIYKNFSGFCRCCITEIFRTHPAIMFEILGELGR